ncbi:MAG: type III pantothenate kinase [Candidatus Kapaibacterium sp.]|jgi:pantothenate kinase type III|nr:type III pantothenate kinase [Candidatus Kapabacteria bacterium]
MDTHESLLFADIGNSRIKLFKDGIKTPFHYKHTGFADNLASYLTVEAFNRLVYSSVNANAENILLSLCRNKKVYDFINIKELLPHQTIIDLRAVKGMGNDRWLGMIGATAYSDPPLITVDCGTAITVNVLDYKYQVLGGAIFAGAYTQKNTLASISEKLGFPKFNFTPEGAGNDTPSAVSLGIIVGVAGGIKMIIEQIIQHDKLKNPGIFFTGGYGGKIQRILAKDFPESIYDENLIFRGMNKIYESTQPHIKNAL